MQFSSIYAYLAPAMTVCALALPAAAQTVYRCGPEGRSYTQQPCDDGRPVRVDDARSDSQRREAEQAAGREARIARRLESERLAVLPVSMATRIEGRGSPATEPPKAKPAAAKKRGKSSSGDASDAEFRAAVPRPAKIRNASASG
jgi:hypothetical protein